jgi:hypothetical protein
MMGMPSCREVVRAVSGEELEKFSLRRRLAVRLHLLMCRHCRRYTLQIRAIGRAAREVFANPSGEQESLERLRRSILRKLDPPDTD